MRQQIPIEHIRHSLAHILAMAVLERWPSAKLGVGPAIENGFYYDFDFAAEERGMERGTTRKPVISEADLPDLEGRMRRILGKNLDFTGKQVSFTEAREFFQKKNQPYKLDLINDLEIYGTTDIHLHENQKPEARSQKLKTVGLYQTGNFVDLCRGGHVKNTKEIDPDAFRVTKIAGAYWRGSEKNPMLTRIYAVAFQTKQELDKYLKLQEEVARRDHRKIGEALDLFSFHDIAPGAPFWHPKGMIIFRELEKIWREIHDSAGYLETSTPIMVKGTIFQQSGHLEHYRENMFRFVSEDEDYYLKPMNCPESTLIYRSKVRSYRDLPIRLSEIGRLHRNELSGTLGGLFRVRQLIMDDAHIYCRPDQILSEVTGVLKLVLKFYKIFNFKPSFKLATRPDKAMGDPKLWEKAEKSLEFALKKNKVKYDLKPKDGAFYGPKIDIHINDALGRDWQLATIQLDFQMPERFGLEYTNEKGGKDRPVMIHRAIFGSFERFIGILLEHYAGALPFWLAPIQAVIIPIGSAHQAYAKKVGKSLMANGLRVEVWDQNETVSKKIRSGELQKIPYLLVVGDKEKKAKAVRVRERGRGDIGMKGLDALVKTMLKRTGTKT